MSYRVQHICNIYKVQLQIILCDIEIYHIIQHAIYHVTQHVTQHVT